VENLSNYHLSLSRRPYFLYANSNGKEATISGSESWNEEGSGGLSVAIHLY